MINKLRFDEAFTPALQLVFGKTMICRNLEVASQFSKSDSLDCITLEGVSLNYFVGTLVVGNFYNCNRTMHCL